MSVVITVKCDPRTATLARGAASLGSVGGTSANLGSVLARAEAVCSGG